MSIISKDTLIGQTRSLSQLEQFVRRYAEELGGGFDEVEPQVYDLLVDRGLVRVCFDAEALAEHHEAQLASLGSPLLSEMLDDAARRGAVCVGYLNGLNSRPHDLAGRLGRAYSLPDKFTLKLEHWRPLLFPQCVCWFELTFESDQREQELLPAAVDLASGRSVRQIERLMDLERLGEQPFELYPTAPCRSLREGCLLAAKQALSTAGALANIRRRELSERLESILARMKIYYAQLIQELNERSAKDEGQERRLAERREAVERERELRLSEVARKHALRASMRIVNVLLVMIPKVMVSASVAGPRGLCVPIRPVFDPLLECFEPIDCPTCGKPSLRLLHARIDQLSCDQCG